MPLSHDEVVHGKGSLLGKMPGDDWQKFANLRLLLGYMFTQPGKKLLFMGAEFGQRREWNHEAELQWDLLAHAPHQGLLRWVTDLNAFYRSERAAHAGDFDSAGYEWIDADDALSSTLSYLRRNPDTATHAEPEELVAVCNFTPVVRANFRVGVPRAGRWRELLNSDASYGGSGVGNLGGVSADATPWHGRAHSLRITLPPLAIVVFRNDGVDG
jgi:1,4-alpha-glucan branching enzyme